MDRDGDGNDDGRKATSLDNQNENPARASRFVSRLFSLASRGSLARALGAHSRSRVVASLYISLPSLDDYDVKMPNLMFWEGREHKTTTFFFFS